MKENTVLQNSSVCASQCTSFWQLCLHQSWQSSRFWNTFI